MIPKRIQAPSVLLMECILRFRRMATLMLFLVSCGAAFLLMPETSSGGVMFLVGSQRVLLNSAATALTSAIMGGLVFSLLGFYLISNSVSRDLHSGVGRLIAATPISSLRYLAGKLAGNILYLTAMVAIFMIACMGMHLIRGERPLEPLVFIQTFGLMFVPSIPCIAAIALMFECVPFLSGRGGDVWYFFFWVLTFTLPVALIAGSNGHPWILAIDFTGMGIFIREISVVTGTNNFTIGYAPYNATLPPIFFAGLRWVPEMILPRLASIFFTIPFFAVAWISFQRFDPARRKIRVTRRTGIIARLRQTIVSGWLRLAVPRGGWLTGAPSFMKIMLLDIRLTLAMSPVMIVVMAASFITGLCIPMNVIRETLLPAIFFVLVPLLAGIATRDRQRNTVSMIFSAPLVREHFAALKFFSALVLAMLVGFMPLVRLSLEDPFTGAAALNAMLLLASAATAAGLLTRTPKTFIALALMFLYMALSSKSIPALDFAGLHGIVTLPIILAYTAASLCMMIIAEAVERWRRQHLESL